MNYTFLIILLFSGTLSVAQWKTEDAIQFQKELNEWYKNPETSPLKGDTLKQFSSLNYYPFDEEYIVEATFIPSKQEKERHFKTSSGKGRNLIEVGIVRFHLKGHTYELRVLEEITIYNPDFTGYLTIPFLDDTNGLETYGGGRYLGVWKDQVQKGTVTLDFNKAYHPYCAYTTGYSCLLPPRKNYINLPIRAGIKKGIVTK